MMQWSDMKLIGILSGILVLTPTQSHEADRYFEWYLSTNSNPKPWSW